MTTFAIATLGCKVNAYESESYVQALNDFGYEEVDFKSKADIYIINTCAVTNTAASKSRQKIHQAIRLNESALICVVGCYIQLKTSDIQEDSRIDILIGSSGKRDLPQIIKQTLQSSQRVNTICDVGETAEFEVLPLTRFTHQTRAYLKVQDGCNQFCAYCIIPYARGIERSLNSDKVLEIAKQLEKNHHEIVLAGIHTGRYGIDQGTNLAQLLKRLLQETKIARIRISSIEINEISDELIELLSTEKRLAPHLHIPIQSGCDETLKRMNRPYNVEQFLKRIETIRQAIPSISISTDVIVGFPEESEAEFEITKNTLIQAQFSFLHVFPFSLKDGTKAGIFKPEVVESIKKQRVQSLKKMSNDLYLSYKSQFINSKVQVLLESNEKGIAFGHTAEYILVNIRGEFKVNEFLPVTITHLQDGNCWGEKWEEER